MILEDRPRQHSQRTAQVHGVLPLVPWCGGCDRSVVCIRVQYLDGVAVPTLIRTFLPQLCPVEIWVGDPVQRERGNGEGDLDGDQDVEEGRPPPFQVDPRQRRHPHDCGEQVNGWTWAPTRMFSNHREL